MSILAAIKYIAPAARALTEGNRMVTLKSTFAPVSEVARSLQNPIQPNFAGYTERVALESEDALTKANEVIVGADAASIEDQVGDLTRNINAMLFTARNVIVPTVDTLVNSFTARQSGSAQPNVSVNVFKYSDVHNAPELINHLVGKYSQIQAFKEYRTFILQSHTAEQIVTLVSENNPHLEQTQVVEWLLGMGADRISSVWTSLFGSSRNFDPNGVSYLRGSNLPLLIDELLLAYCITGAVLQSPQDAIGESVELSEWERALNILHELLGHKLVRAYEYRAQDAKAGRLIITSDGKDAIRTGIVTVLVNGDIYNGWLSSGGDLQALLGAAVYEPQLKTVTALNEAAEGLAKRWSTYYPVLRQTCQDNAIRNRRKMIVDTFLDSTLATVEGLPQLDAGVVRQHLDSELRALCDDAVHCPFRLFAYLVCNVYYRQQPLFLDFMLAMDRYAKIHPGATGRELAIESTIEMVAAWLATQITTVSFKPIVDPNISFSNEDGTNVKITDANQDVADDVGVIHEEPPVDEVADAEQEAEAAETESDDSVGDFLEEEDDGAVDPVDGEPTETEEEPAEGDDLAEEGDEPEAEEETPEESEASETDEVEEKEDPLT